MQNTLDISGYSRCLRNADFDDRFREPGMPDAIENFQSFNMQNIAYGPWKLGPLTCQSPRNSSFFQVGLLDLQLYSLYTCIYVFSILAPLFNQ